MKPIQNPPPPAIGPESSGDVVANLQDALSHVVRGSRKRRMVNEERFICRHQGSARNAKNTVRDTWLEMKQVRAPDPNAIANFNQDRQDAAADFAGERFVSFDVLDAEHGWLFAAVAGSIRDKLGGAYG